MASAFDPPEGQAPYDYVFDLTGEVRYDRTEVVRVPTISQERIAFNGTDLDPNQDYMHRGEVDWPRGCEAQG